MICFPICKINIGLRILEKRSDGYHNIESIFYPIKIADAVEFVVAAHGATADSLTLSGYPLSDSSPNNNIVVKAVQHFRKEADIPFLNIHIHKNIPIGAGLGGGSSDAAYIIKLLNRYFHCGFSESHLELIASAVGSDCPFFIQSKPQLVKGRGELMYPLPNFLDGYRIEVAYPNIFISTREAYLHCTPSSHRTPLEKLIEEPISEWRNTVENDFEKYVFNIHPEIKKIKDDFYSKGALYSSLTGSGSAVYGIFQQ